MTVGTPVYHSRGTFVITADLFVVTSTPSSIQNDSAGFIVIPVRLVQASARQAIF